MVLKRDRTATVVLCLVTMLASGLIAGVATFAASASELVPDISPVVDAIVFGLAIGPAVGFAFVFALSGLGSAWPRWVFAREVLAIRRATPQRLLAFLEDAHARGVLRQVGPVYQFRHIELQHRLASRATRSTSPNWLQQVAVSARWNELQTGSQLRPFKPFDHEQSRRRKYVLRIAAIAIGLAVAVATGSALDHVAITHTADEAGQSLALVPVVTCPASSDAVLGEPPCMDQQGNLHLCRQT